MEELDLHEYAGDVLTPFHGRKDDCMQYVY